MNPALPAYQTDFRNFLYLAYQHLGLPAPTRIQYSIAYFMQHGPDRLMVKAFRGAGKSWIAAIFCLWSLLNDPNANIMVFSASKARSDGFTTFCLRLIDEMPILAHLRPREGQRRSSLCFDVGPAKASQTPSVFSVGIMGTATGFRATLIIADDVEVPNNAETVIQREKLFERTKEFDAILKPNGRVLYLGTDQTDDSLYRALPDRGYVVRIWPVQIDCVEDIAAYEGMLAPDIEEWVLKENLFGTSLEADRFTNHDLEKRRLSYGKAGYDQQFKLDPRRSAADMCPLKCHDLMVYPLNNQGAPERLLHCHTEEYIDNNLECVGLRGDHWVRAMVPPNTPYVPWTGTVMAVDPAGRGKDETGYAVVSACNGLLFLRASGGLKGYGDDTMEALATIAKMYNVNTVVVEPNFGDGMFKTVMAPVFRRIHPVSIVDSERSSVQKEKRIIATLGPVMEQHRLVVDTQVIKADFNSVRNLPTEVAQFYRLFYQMSRITPERGCLRFDDRLDAFSLAVAYWQKVLGLDVESAAKETKDRALKEELKRFEEHVLNRPKRSPTWTGGSGIQQGGPVDGRWTGRGHANRRAAGRPSVVARGRAGGNRPP